jgi:DNA-binding NtrC family response regulator
VKNAMANNAYALRAVEDNQPLTHGDASLRAGLGLVKELTAALLHELKALEHTEPRTIAGGIDFNEEVRRFEIDLIKRALARTGGHQTRAARLLGIKLTTLHDKIKRYDIDPHHLDTFDSH